MNGELISYLRDEEVDINEFYRSLPQYRKDHCSSVADLAARLTEWAAADGLVEADSAQVEKIHRASLYHDIGMTLIPERLFLKIENLTGAEYKVIQRHTTYGADLLDRYRKNHSSAFSEEAGFWSMAAEIALSHHERWDGKGYPYGQSTTGVFFWARAVAVADAYDSIIRGADFRMPLPPEYALLEIKQNIGIQFDPMLAECFCRHVSRDLLI